MELIRANPNAFVLLYVMAHRARWSSGFNAEGLEPGESLLGDFESYGMTMREYRTAKQNLEKWKFATFKTTNKGTVGKIINTRVFSILGEPFDNQNDKRPTSKRQASDKRPTTNYKGIEGIEGIKGGNPPVTADAGSPEKLSQSPGWKLAKDLRGIQRQITQAKESANPDLKLIAGLQATLAPITAEIRQRGKPATVKPSVSRSTSEPKRVINIHEDLTPEQRNAYTAKLRAAANGSEPQPTTEP